MLILAIALNDKKLITNKQVETSFKHVPNKGRLKIKVVQTKRWQPVKDNSDKSMIVLYTR